MKLEELSSDPLIVFKEWFDSAVQAGIPAPETMTLSTATRDGTPSARVVLSKGWNAQGLRFFTNYRSRKARELQENPKACAVFYWRSDPQKVCLERQVRIEGRIEKLSPPESDEYWRSRPKESRLGALASEQSSRIESREVLEDRFQRLMNQFQSEVEVPRPEHWGGYVLIPHLFEFWVAGQFRLHDRFLYTRSDGSWQKIRLSP